MGGRIGALDNCSVRDVANGYSTSQHIMPTCSYELSCSCSDQKPLHHFSQPFDHGAYVHH